MTLRDHGGGKLTGTYTQDEGRVFFAGPENRLDGHWVERSSAQKCSTQMDGSHDWGRMVVVFDAALSSFQGLWSYCDAPLISANKSTGTRIKPVSGHALGGGGDGAGGVGGGGTGRCNSPTVWIPRLQKCGLVVAPVPPDAPPCAGSPRSISLR